MGYSRKQLESKGIDEKAYQKYFAKYQQEHLRVRLRCLQSYFSGGTPKTIGHDFGIHEQTVRIYLQTYVSGGFEALCAPIQRPKPTMLNEDQMAAFKSVLLDCRPNEVGLEGNIWTGKVMRQYLQNTYQITYKSGIYDLLERLGLSHQKAHSDYANAKPEEQQLFLEDLKKTLLQADERTAVAKFDEFSVSSRPSSHYGWAQKNTRPTVKTDEKNASAQMAF